MAAKKQSQKKSDKDSKGPVLFEDNIQKHQEDKKDLSEDDKKETETYRPSAYMIKLVLVCDFGLCPKTSPVIRNNPPISLI